MSTENEQTKRERLEKILSFPTVGITETPKQSTIQRRQIAQGGIITETIIDSADSTTTVRYRQQTNKEKLDKMHHGNEHLVHF